MSQRQVVVLAHQRKNYRRQVPLEGKARDDLLKQWLISRNEGAYGYFQPRLLCALPRMIQPGQLVELGGQTRPCISNDVHQSDPINAAQVLARHALQHLFHVGNGIPGELTLRLVLNLDSHNDSTSPPGSITRP